MSLSLINSFLFLKAEFPLLCPGFEPNSGFSYQIDVCLQRFETRATAE